MLEYEICQNNDLNCIIYLCKLLTVNKTEFLTVSNNLLFKKQCCKSKQAAWYSFCICLQNEAYDLSYSFSICVLNEACDLSAVRMQQSTLIHFIFLILLQFYLTTVLLLFHSILSCASCILLSLRTVTFFKKRDICYEYSIVTASS